MANGGPQTTPSSNTACFLCQRARQKQVFALVAVKVLSSASRIARFETRSLRAQLSLAFRIIDILIRYAARRR